RMPQYILAVAGAKAQPAEQMNDLRIQARHVGFLGGLLTALLDVLLHLGLGFIDDLFDPGRMDATVGDELVETKPGNLTAYGVKTADDDHARCVVNDHVDAGRFLERAD